MKQVIGSTWVFQLVIIFILIFASYLTITVSYSKAFKLKNEMLNIIEKKEGLTQGGNGAMGIINKYLAAQGYSSKGVCEAGYYGAKTILGNDTDSDYEFVENGDRTKYYYCVTKVSNYFSGRPSRSYYRIELFFNMDLPVIGNIITFTASGSTIELDATYDSLFQINYNN